MNYKTEARLVYGGLLIALLVFAWIVGRWYGVFERHSPERALAAEIEKEIKFDVLFISYDEESFEEKMLLVHILIDGELSALEAIELAGSRPPSVYYIYQPIALNSSEDGSPHEMLYAIGFVLCLSMDDCVYMPTEKFVGAVNVEGWWFGYEKGSQSWIKSERNILVVLERLFKPEVKASEQSIEEAD